MREENTVLTKDMKTDASRCFGRDIEMRLFCKVLEEHIHEIAHIGVAEHA